MLIVHPSSRCDVCLDGYNWTTPANAPHAIYCGHIFCKTCLSQLEAPSTCPLCRKPFALDKVKKLIVDRVSPASEEAAGPGGRDEASVLLEQIALVSGEETPADQAHQVLSGAEEWLKVQPANPATHRALQAAISALTRYRELQAKTTELKSDYKTLRHHYKKKQRAWDQDKSIWDASEQRLMAQRDEAIQERDDAVAQVAKLEKQLAMATFNPSSLGLAPFKHIPPEKKPIKSAMKFTQRSPPSSESSSDDAGGGLGLKGRKKRNDPTKAPRMTTTALHPPPGMTPSVSAPALGNANTSETTMVGRAASMMPPNGVRSADSSFDMSVSGDTSFGSTHSKLSSVASSSSLTDRGRSREPSSSSSFEPGSMASSFTSNGMHYYHNNGGANSAGGGRPGPPMNEQSLQLVDKWLQRTGLEQVPQPAIEQPVARPAEPAVPSWAQPQPPAPGLRRNATTASTSSRRTGSDELVPRQDSRGSSRSQRSARSSRSPAIATNAPVTTAQAQGGQEQGQGLGSLGLYSEPRQHHQQTRPPPRVRDDTATTTRRSTRRARNGSATDTEGLGPSLSSLSGRNVHRGLARVQAAGMTRENSAPGAASSTTGRQGLSSMGSFADLGLVSLPPSNANTSQNSEPSSTISSLVRERPGARDAPQARPDSVLSSSSWGTMGTPSPRPHLSELDLELAHIRTPPTLTAGELQNGNGNSHHARSESLPNAFPGQGPVAEGRSSPPQTQTQRPNGVHRTPGPRVARLLVAAQEEDEGLQTPRNRQNELLENGHPHHIRPRGHSESDAQDAGGLGLSLSNTQAAPPRQPATHPTAPPMVRTAASAPGPPTMTAEQARPHLPQRATVQAVPHAAPVSPPVAAPAGPKTSDRPAAYRTMSQAPSQGHNISPPQSVPPQQQQQQQPAYSQLQPQPAPAILHPNASQTHHATATYYAQHPHMGMSIAPGQPVPVQMVPVPVPVPVQQGGPSAPRAQRRHTMAMPMQPVYPAAMAYPGFMQGPPHPGQQPQPPPQMVNMSTPWSGQVQMSAHTPYAAPPQLGPRS